MAAQPGLPKAALAQAQEEMLVAEGSDWFWWYGDDHSSDHDLEFDELFRRHVRNIYRALEKPIPEELFVSNITTQPPSVDIEPPTGFVQPTIDGEVTSYFEWIGAGCVDANGAAGAMHRVAQRTGLTLIEFGFDLDHLYLRLDGTQPMRDLLESGLEVIIRFLKPAGLRVALRGAVGRTVTAEVERRVGGVGAWAARPCPGVQTAVDTVGELRIPFTCLGVANPDPLAFIVVLNREGVEIEHHPRNRPIEFAVPDQRFPSVNWTA
jgi:hypothetical protein